jgi:hypothetical protein
MSLDGDGRVHDRGRVRRPASSTFHRRKERWLALSSLAGVVASVPGYSRARIAAVRPGRDRARPARAARSVVVPVGRPGELQGVGCAPPKAAFLILLRGQFGSNAAETLAFKLWARSFIQVPECADVQVECELSNDSSTRRTSEPGRTETQTETRQDHEIRTPRLGRSIAATILARDSGEAGRVPYSLPLMHRV